MKKRNLNKKVSDAQDLAHRLVHMLNEIDEFDEFDEFDHYESSAPRTLEDDLTNTSDVDFARSAEMLYNHRRKRNKYFLSNIFSDPAWDMLLDLFVQTSRNRPVSVTSACIAGEIPTTTGLRWIKILEQEGLVERVGSNSDARVTWLRLTSKAMELMKSYLADGINDFAISIRKRQKKTALDSVF